MALAAEEALMKINEVLPDSEKQRAKAIQIHAFSDSTMTEELRRLIDTLETAVDNATRLSFGYSDKQASPTQRTVRPLGLWFWGKVWTLVAWCELREDFRIFRIDRISDLAHLGEFKAEPTQTIAHFFASKAYLRKEP